MTGIIRRQLGNVTGPAFRVADAIQQQLHVPQPQRQHQAPAQFYYLHVHRWVGVPQRFDAELMVLPKPSCLGPLVAEHRTKIIQAHRLGQVVHPVFQVSPADGSSTFRPQGDAVAAPVLEGVRFFFDDVGAFANRPHKKARVFKDRSIDAAVAVLLGQLHGLGLNISPVFLLRWQKVYGTSRGLEQRNSSPRIRSYDYYNPGPQITTLPLRPIVGEVSEVPGTWCRLC